MAPNFVEQHQMTSDRDFRDPTILPQVTTIQDFVLETYRTAGRIDVLGTIQCNDGDRKAQISKCTDRILYDKSLGCVVPNAVWSLTSRTQGGPLRFCEIQKRLAPSAPKSKNFWI